MKCSKCNKDFDLETYVPEEAFPVYLKSDNPHWLAQAGKHSKKFEDGIVICWECFLTVLLEN